MKKLTTLLDWIRYSASQLSKPEVESQLVFGHGSFNAFDEAHALVLGLLHLPFNLDVSYFNAHLTDEEIASIKQGLEQRINDKKPVPYITSRAMFMGLEFYVDERVLVPRSPIMELIENQFMPYREQPAHSVLDLCCGSGCIGIASAYMLPEAEVVISDIDDGALEVANLNIDKHDIHGSVTAVQSDVFDNLEGHTFDIIVSNPPYVDSETVAHLPEEFLHEPEIGLGSGEDGLDITRRILRDAISYLNEGGLLIVEVGASWDLLEQAYPHVVFHWHEFESPAEGVFVMTYDELTAYQEYF
ncbi:MAG: 50S ribosomal protein L3 N(5)-glutamine methyltransferase [Gammaproteobacteria bacterium]|nr:50S ribosomal protein L3 N(5)-glutamine methyltransferase [Gammaproteobacteria bacterium]